MKPVKDKLASIRLPEKTRSLVQEEANKNFRTFADEALSLISEGLHSRKMKRTFDPRDYT